MIPIHFPAPYTDAITGRDVANAVHHEDDSDGGVAWVDTVREGDTVITEAEYEVLRDEILAYNAALPEPEMPLTPNPNGYLVASMGVFATEEEPTGLVRGNEVLSRWPSFSTALLQANWTIARATLAAAFTVGTVTQAEYDALDALFAEYGIPEASS